MGFQRGNLHITINSLRGGPWVSFAVLGLLKSSFMATATEKEREDGGSWKGQFRSSVSTGLRAEAWFRRQERRRSHQMNGGVWRARPKAWLWPLKPVGRWAGLQPPPVLDQEKNISVA